ncbi:MAG: dihydropteroate synthase [Candidatus Obscuribacterales bacterium]|nr:dihydropteroate synthase [Steroidobacteraceae bacterium]
MLLRCGSRTLDLSMPIVMGVLNITPDSFSDGGRWLDPARAIEQALKMIDEGAGVIDIGGESTRPGAAAVSIDEELRRVVPVIEAIAARSAIPISVDTSRPEVIRVATDAGATLINDIRGLRAPGALAAAAATSAAVCVMHMQGEPRTMQTAPTYENVFAEVRQFLTERIAACEQAGIPANRIVVDPGIGFGKRLEHNLELLIRIRELQSFGLPVLIGVSRKSIIGAITGRSVEQRLAGGLAFATAAVLGGASIIRAHDVAATVDAVKVATALRDASKNSEGRVAGES